VEALRKIFDTADITAYSFCRVVETLEFLQHHFSEMGHRDLLVTHIYLSRWATTDPLPHAKRPPPGGYVQTA
jgi:hypothetical protein